MLKMLLKSSALVLLMGAVFSPLKADKKYVGAAEEDNLTRPVSSKKKRNEGKEENEEEKEFSLSNALNLEFNMDEKTSLPKGWNLVDSAKKRDINKPVSLKKKPKGIELLGDNYTFYTNVPDLGNFVGDTFVFSAEVRSTKPGVYIQYFDGKQSVTSTPYASKRGEWETLNIEFTVEANAKFHRLYSAILGSVRGTDNPSVDINNITLQSVEKNVVEAEENVSLLSSRNIVEDKGAEPKKEPFAIVGASQAPGGSVGKTSFVEKEGKELSLSPMLNDMDEKTSLPKGWNLVDSAKKRDINKPVSLKKKPKGIELLGDNYTFYTNVPDLGNFVGDTFVFSAEVRSTKPGVYIQYFDGKQSVTSTPYASKRGEWETLNIEFTVEANAKFHRLYSAILGSVRGTDNPSVDINNITLQRKEPPIALFEPEEKKKAVVASEKEAPKLPPRVIKSEKEEGVGSEKKVPEKPKVHPLANEKVPSLAQRLQNVQLTKGKEKSSPLEGRVQEIEKEIERLTPIASSEIILGYSVAIRKHNQERAGTIKRIKRLEEEKTKLEELAIEQKRKQRRAALRGEDEESEDEEYETEVATINLSLGEQIQAIEEKIAELAPIASSEIIPGYSVAIRKHNQERANAIKSIARLSEEKASLVSKVEELAAQKKEEKAQKKRKRERQLQTQQKLAKLSKEAEKGKVVSETRRGSIENARTALRSGGHLPIDHSEKVDTRAAMLDQISKGQTLKKIDVPRTDAALEVSKKEFLEARKFKQQVEENLAKKAKELEQLESQYLEAKRLKEEGEPETTEEEWDLPEHE